MASFFSGVQSYFKADFAGRYIGILLTEVCRMEPTPFKRFLASSLRDARYRKGSVELRPEFAFPTRKGTRRADLLVTLDGTPSALIELKFNDKLIPKTTVAPAQLTDYLSYCRRNNLHFLLLSKDPPSLDELGAIGMHRQRREHFSALAACLGASSQPASRMLYEYFRDKGLVVEPLDQDVLYRFFHRFLKPWGQAGRINSQEALSEGPAQFQALLNNMRLVATSLTPKIRPARGASRTSRSATIDFHIENHFERDALKRALNREKRGVVFEPDHKIRRGGTVSVYAMHSLAGRAKKWLYLEYGLGFRIKPGADRSLKPFIYTTVYGRQFEGLYLEGNLPFSFLTKPERKGELEEEMLKAIRKAARGASKMSGLGREGRAALLRI